MKRRTPPFWLALAGGSASGKTTLARMIKAAMGPRAVQLINMDHFYKTPDRMPKYRSSLDGKFHPHYNHPRAIKWDELLGYCGHAFHHRLVILEGLFALYHPRLRSKMDLCVFLNCAERLRRKRRMIRGEPAWGLRGLQAYYRDCVLTGHKRFVAPTRKWADTVLSQSRAGHRRLIRRLRSAVSLEKS